MNHKKLSYILNNFAHAGHGEGATTEDLSSVCFVVKSELSICAFNTHPNLRQSTSLQ
jgi:hypothetical protein